jgi:glycine reductase
LSKLKALFYVNQFFAGLGGEEMAHEGLHIFDEPKGPAVGVAAMWKGEMEVVKTFACGDNYINLEENYEAVKPEILKLVDEVKPDVIIAGPAFNAGRYGVACGRVCDLITKERGIPSVTGMFPTNPAVAMFLRKTVIAETTETVAGMRKSLPILAAIALKLAKKEPLGTASKEGYIETGIRINEVDENSAANRVVSMLLAKLQNKPFITEVPLRKEGRVDAAKPLSDYSKVKFGFVTTGGLVPKGNPDKIRMYAADSYGSYKIVIDTFNKDNYESVHGGYDTTAVNEDPQRLVPYTAALNLKERGIIGDCTDYFFSTVGVGTNVGMSMKLGADMAEKFIADGVQAVFLTST